MNQAIRAKLSTRTALHLVVEFTLLFLLGWTSNSIGQTVTPLHSFSGSDGSSPKGQLVEGSDGNFYGTTSQGGAYTYGTIFRISPGGTFTNLYSFTNGSDGATPYAALIQGSDGNFYGTTSGSGSGSSAKGNVFRFSPSGGLTNLYSFSGNDGNNSLTSLVQGNDGNFYGSTMFGGTNGDGNVFRISPSGGFTNLYTFGGVDGVSPSTLVQGSDGNFYGTTISGGSNFLGNVFLMTPSGNLTSLHTFNGSDGANPESALVQGSDGNFYGTTDAGGNANDGTVFSISPSGNFTNLYSFSVSGGFFPYGALVQGSDGNFYGTTEGGPTNLNFGSGNGTVFSISPSGSLTNLYSFRGSDGRSPHAGLVQGSDGKFYGTTSNGGAGSAPGCVFRLSVPLSSPPYPINLITSAQVSGTNIVLTIQSIAYETYQLQFSSSMNPTNWVNVPNVSVTNCIGALLTLTNFGGASQPQGFYRFDITP